jgi:phosphoglycerate dehydrogenase-like enzyme
MSIGTEEKTIYEAVKDADIAITGIEAYTANVIEKCPNLKMISRRGIGYDSVDLEACKARNIALACTVGCVEGAVAEHVMAYILYFARRIDLQNSSMHNNEWNRILTSGAKNRTLGLIGFGGIGKEIAKRAAGFGMNVYYNCRHPEKHWEDEYDVKYMPLDELLAISDYISVNVPLTEKTKNLCNSEMFSKMKKGSYFINIARGPIVKVADLEEYLKNGHLAGAAIDVFDTEPCTDSPLAKYENVILTPHTATYTSENFTAMNEATSQNVLDFIAGRLNKNNQIV